MFHDEICIVNAGGSTLHHAMAIASRARFPQRVLFVPREDDATLKKNLAYA